MPGEFNDLIPPPNQNPRRQIDEDLLEADGLFGFIGESAPPQPDPAAAPGNQEVGVVDASATGLAQGLTLNTSDEIFSALATPFVVAARAAHGDDEGRSFSDRVSGAFSDELASQRALIEEAKRQQPLAFALGEISGTIAGPGKLFKAAGFATRATSRLGKLGGAVADVSAIGALAGAGGADGENILSEASIGGAGAVALAPLGAAAGKGVGLAIDKAAERFKAVPALKTLRDMTRKVTSDADAAGFTISKKFIRQFEAQARGFAKRRGKRARTPETAQILNRMHEMARGRTTFGQLLNLRQDLRASAQLEPTGSPAHKLAQAITTRLDTSVTRLSPKSIKSSQSRVERKGLDEIREIWRRAANGEKINDLFENAQRVAGSNSTSRRFAIALRAEFTKLSRDDARMRTFNMDEQASIQRVVNEGGAERLANVIGGLADQNRFSTDILKNSLGAASGGFLGGTFGDVVGGAAGAMIGTTVPSGAGLAARAAANRIIRDRADTAGRVARRGGPRQPQNPAASEASALVRLGLAGQGSDLAKEMERRLSEMP